MLHSTLGQQGKHQIASLTATKAKMQQSNSKFSPSKKATTVTGLDCTRQQLPLRRHHRYQNQRLCFSTNCTTSRSKALFSLVTVSIFLIMSLPFIFQHHLSLFNLDYNDVSRSLAFEARAKFNNLHLHRQDYLPIIPKHESIVLVKDKKGGTTLYSTPNEKLPSDDPSRQKTTDIKITRTDEAESPSSWTKQLSVLPMENQMNKDIRESRGAVLDASVPFIHIVNTRFQQYSRNLTAIGNARLELFETFCLPSMIHQTIQPQVVNQTHKSEQPYRFLWIIKTDPKLNSELRSKMVELLQPYPNFFLVGTNNNYPWRGGKGGNDVLYGNATSGAKNYERPIIYTGDVSLILFAHENREEKIVLETRLDADDGLPRPYLDYVQTSAMDRLFSSISMKQNEREGGEISKNVKRARWFFWCMPNSVNWYPSVTVEGFNPKSSLAKEEEPGVLVWEENIVCLTPGLTTGLSVGVRESELPFYSHHRLLQQLYQHRNSSKNFCGLQEFNLPCIQVLDMVLALRARTPTSAGMNNAIIKEKVKYSIHQSNAQWKVMKKKFGVERRRAVHTNRYILENIENILKDNLLSQCAPGHSCKNSSRELLKSMIKKASESKEIQEETQ